MEEPLYHTWDRYQKVSGLVNVLFLVSHCSAAILCSLGLVRCMWRFPAAALEEFQCVLCAEKCLGVLPCRGADPISPTEFAGQCVRFTVTSVLCARVNRARAPTGRNRGVNQSPSFFFSSVPRSLDLLAESFALCFHRLRCSCICVFLGFSALLVFQHNIQVIKIIIFINNNREVDIISLPV